MNGAEEEANKGIKRDSTSLFGESLIPPSAATRQTRFFPPKQCLEQLSAMSFALNSSDAANNISAEEKERQQGVIYSRRKRLRQKMRVDELEAQKAALVYHNDCLRVENDQLESILREALAEVALVERRMVGTGNTTKMRPFPDHPELKAAAGWAGGGGGVPASGLYGGGGMLPRYGHPLPRTRQQSEMGLYGPPVASMLPRPDAYSFLQRRDDPRLMLRAGAGAGAPTPRHQLPVASPFDAQQQGYFPWGDHPTPP